MRFYRSEEFKALLKEWDIRLADSGFVDIEQTVGENRELIQFASNAYRQAVQNVIDTKRSYYETLSQYVAKEEFPFPVHAFIMTRYAEGATIKSIVDELAQQGVKIHRQTVRYITRRYEQKWQIKVYKKTQIYSNLHGKTDE